MTRSTSRPKIKHFHHHEIFGSFVSGVLVLFISAVGLLMWFSGGEIGRETRKGGISALRG